LSVSRADENGDRPDVEAEENVACFVSDHVGPGEIEVEFIGRPPPHLRKRLSAGTFLFIARLERRRKMRTGIDRVDARAVPMEIRFHPVMKGRKLLFSDQSPGDTGLIGDNDGQKMGLIEKADGLKTEWIEVKGMIRVGVADISVERSISIKEDRFFFHERYVRQME
jgi:hypothetical protein